MSQLQLILLGGVRLSWQGEPLKLSAPRLLGLVAYLHLRGPTSREELMEVFWSGRNTQHLRQALYLLRALPGAAHWLHDAPSSEAVALVSVQAGSDLAEIRERLKRQEYASALGALHSAGPLLGTLPDVAPVFNTWLDEQRDGLAQERLSALRAYGAELVTGKKYDLAREQLQYAIELDPLDEATYRSLMHLEHAAGRPDQALGVFEQCRLALQSELDSTPEAATLDLLARIEGEGHDQRGGSMRALRLSHAQITGRMTEPLCGRENELEQVLSALEGKGQVLLQGMGGIGKTRLAWAVAKEVSRQGGEVLWLELGRDPLENVLPALLSALDAKTSAELGRDVQTLQAALAQRGIKLLVLDNAQSSYALHTLLDVLPGELRVLVTARQRLPKLSRVTLEKLSRVSSLSLLRVHLPAENPLASSALDALCAVLGDHPYALRLAGKTLAQGRLEPQELLRTLMTEGLAGSDSQQSIGNLIQQSSALLGTASYEAYLGIGSLPAPQTTPELLSLALRRPLPEVEQALYTLVEHGLLHRETRPGSEQVAYQMHELTWAEAASHRMLLWGSVVHAACAFAEGYSAQADLLSTELPNLLRAAQIAREKGEHAALVRLMCGWLGGQYIAARGFPTGQLDLLQSALRAAEGRQDWAAASLLGGKLGDIWHALLGNHQAAITAYLAAAEQSARAGLSARQATQLALAGVLEAMNHLPQAQHTLTLAQQVAQRSGDVLCQSKVLEHRGIACAIGRDFAGARDLLSQARQVLAPHLLSTPPPEPRPDQKALHTAYIGATSNLGQAEQRLGNLDAALALKEEALRLAQQGDDQLLIARAHSGRGEILALSKRPVEAIQAFKTALGIFSQLGATAHEEATRRQLNAVYTALDENDSPGGQT